MTLCELATAKHHAPPMECDVFSARLHEPSYKSGFSEQQNEEFENSRGKCVNALSRSAQFWSSYSGYLREIPQLCFTFQRGNDIDNAKEIFRNISLNQDVFLQMVVDREHVNKAHAERWSAYFDDAADIANEISLLTQRIQAEASGAVEELQKHGIDTLGIVSRSLSEFRSQAENDHSNQVKEINSALAGLSERHSHDLQAIVPELEVIMRELITQLFETARKEQGAVLSELTTSVQDQWRVLYSEFSAMHEAISHLTASTTSTSLSITSHFRQTTQDIHQAHALISNSANQLSDVLDRLAERTNEHMEVLNVKAEELKEKLLPPPTKEDHAWFSYESVTSERWWKGKLVSVLGFLIRGASLSAWTNPPFLQMLEIIWIVTFWLLRQSLSTITSFIILCLSCRKYVQRVFVTSTSLNWTPDNSESNLERQTQEKILYQDPNLYDITSLTTRTLAYNSQEYHVQSPSPETAYTHQDNARLPQGRVMTSRIRLSGVSTPSASSSSRFTSRIPDRLCMSNLA
ncbi:hypothetical protein DFJ43DRAFT_67545 [Lentinula guzmanii]|uniref:Nuclear fusion protein KAR5 n=1 Tax=Lentinula guzmanii TaxID=2804957 RepID=A0AA38JMM6_9AGAR|nr:hypothetical protein DFJ43DRAFT_67545 [Lentinula guzmanii]